MKRDAIPCFDPRCVDAAIASRRSVRAYLDRPVPRELVEEILEVAARAPSGTNTQPWQVIALTGAPKEALSRRICTIAIGWARLWASVSNVSSSEPRLAVRARTSNTDSVVDCSAFCGSCASSERPHRTHNDNERTTRLFMLNHLSSVEWLPVRLHYDQQAGDRCTEPSGLRQTAGGNRRAVRAGDHGAVHVTSLL
mgnify:CR=1 FL=1